MIHKRGAHEKLVFIDNAILWVGSLNPLSFSNTQEVMERRNNPVIVEDYLKTIRLNELIAEYAHECPKCPCCGNEIVAAEGRDEPFYWQCVGCDYSRSAHEPHLADGILRCQKCDPPSTVEFYMPKTTPIGVAQ